jgi:hypothetical protein
MENPVNPPKKELRKTEMCRNWEAQKDCPHYRRGNCAFAHGQQEMHPRERPEQYKTEMCRAYWETGGPPGCRFGKRCRYVHDLEESPTPDRVKLPRHRLPIFNQITVMEE